MTRKRPLGLDVLEARDVPALFGFPWQDPGNLTISFARNGTDVASHDSTLFNSLDQLLPRADWQSAILRAFQTWAVHANLDFGFRADGGQAFGAAGLSQGDPRFGDIRIGAHAMTPEVLAVAIPPDPSVGGTWSGDILLNTALPVGGDPAALTSLMLHEVGHALGISNSNDPGSVMFSRFDPDRLVLSAEDIARLQALYGPRAADPYEGAGGNGTLTTAAPFKLPEEFKGETPMIAFGDLTHSTDVDFYTFTFPDDGNDDQHDREMTIRVQTAGISLMAPRLTVLGEDGRVLASEVSGSVFGGTLQVKLTGMSSTERYYVKVESASGDEFGVGGYGLSVRLDKTSSIADPVIDRLLRGPFEGLGPDAIDAFFRTSGDVLLNPDSGEDDVPAGATALTPTPGYAPGTRFETVASLAKKEDVDVYRLTAPTGAARVLTATVWTADGTGFQPVVKVRDAAGNPVAAEVLVNGNGTSTVQVAGTLPGEVYFLEVTVAGQADQDKGNYHVSSTFDERAVELRTFAQGSLSDDNRQDSARLYVAQTQLFHFVLAVGGQDPGPSVRLTIQDARGRTVYSLTARSGTTISGGSLLLPPGAYTVRYQVSNPNGQAITYGLRGTSKTDPIGPTVSDPTLAPQYTTPPPPIGMPPYYAYPGFTVPYDPTALPGYIIPGEPTTYPLGFVAPPDLINHPWGIATTDPFYWIAIGL